MNQTVTSSCPSNRVKNTQEDTYGSKVTGLILRENGENTAENIPVVLEKDHDTSKTNGDDSVRIAEFSDRDSLPHDLSVKAKVAENDEDLDVEDQSSGEGLVPLYRPPSSQVGDKQNLADLKRCPRKHTGDLAFRVLRGSVVKCLTRNSGVLVSSRSGSSGLFCGSVLGQDTSEPSLVLLKPRKDMNNVSCRRDLTEILLKPAQNIIQSTNQLINLAFHSDVRQEK